MLNKKQIEIADFLLKYLYSAGGSSSLDDYPAKLRKQGFDDFEWHTLRQILIENLELINFVGRSDYNIMLTPDGNKAAKIGIEKYLTEIEQDKQLDRAAKKSSIHGIRNAKIFSGIAIVISILSLIKEPLINKISNTNNQSHNGQEISNPNIPIQLTDTLFIEELKNSLKHDTVFLNDIKDLINQNE